MCAGFRQCGSSKGVAGSANDWDVPLELRCALDDSLTTWATQDTSPGIDYLFNVSWCVLPACFYATQQCATKLPCLSSWLAPGSCYPGTDLFRTTQPARGVRRTGTGTNFSPWTLAMRRRAQSPAARVVSLSCGSRRCCAGRAWTGQWWGLSSRRTEPCSQTASFRRSSYVAPSPIARLGVQRADRSADGGFLV